MNFEDFTLHNKIKLEGGKIFSKTFLLQQQKEEGKELIKVLESLKSLLSSTIERDFREERERRIFSNLPLVHKLSIEGYFNPLIVRKRVVTGVEKYPSKYKTIKEYEYDRLWGLFSEIVKEMKGLERRNFVGEKFALKYESLIGALGKKVEKKEMPNGLDSFFKRETIGGNTYYIGLSERGRDAFKKVYTKVREEYNADLNLSKLHREIINDLMEKSKKIKGKKRSKGCYAEYEVSYHSDFPMYIFDVVYPTIKNIYTNTRICSKNGKRGITYSLLKQLTNTYTTEDSALKFENVDNEKEIRKEWKKRHTKIKKRIKELEDFFFRQEEIRKENQSNINKFNKILNEREGFLFLKDSKQLIDLSNPPKSISFEGFSLEGSIVRLKKRDVKIGNPIVRKEGEIVEAMFLIRLNERWGEVKGEESPVHPFATVFDLDPKNRNIFKEREIEDKMLLRLLNKKYEELEKVEQSPFFLPIKQKEYFEYFIE
jgi:hypothetical protein